MAPDSFIHNASPFKVLIAIALLVWVATNSMLQLVAELWAKITPLKNKPTFIEDEIIHVLSNLFGITIFTAIFLKLGLADLPIIVPVLLLASLPSSFIAYVHMRLNAKAFLNSDGELIVDENIKHDESDDNIDCQGFDPSSLNILAYLVASTIFALTLAISVCIIIFLKTGLQPDKFISIIISIFMACGLTAIFVTAFGHAILPLGVKIKTKLNMTPGETRTGIASTWFLGFMTITTIFVVIFGGVRPPSSLGALLASWHLWVTYILFGVSSYVGGLALKSFYKPKPISTVFA